ncbi:MAG: 1-deoxy-D-xylulose 5-phosphate reductoisomerase [bacterium]|nr:MAG: 1-deoxy-D-xylulose 5-phosphate reductoisomerase [bacterium]
MKGIGILGSTGSVGIQTLSVISKFPKLFKVEMLTSFHFSDELIKQIKRFKPSYVYTKEKSGFSLEGEEYTSSIDDLFNFFDSDRIDLIVSAISGTCGIVPTYEAVLTGKEVAIANKESWVSAGPFLKNAINRSGAKVIPVDSEHSAVFQAIGKDKRSVKKIILTASRGPFHDVESSGLKDIGIGEVMKHPVWSMGPKISVDSATFFNKGFEIIEAAELFDLDFEDIDVFVHKQGIVHSLVGFSDGSLIAQLGQPDMRIPIGYALNYPERLPSLPDDVGEVEFDQMSNIKFDKPNEREKRTLAVVKEAWIRGIGSRIVLNAADEAAVNAFLSGRIRFCDIVDFVENKVINISLGEVFGMKDVIELSETLLREFDKELNKKI